MPEGRPDGARPRGALRRRTGGAAARSRRRRRWRHPDAADEQASASTGHPNFSARRWTAAGFPVPAPETMTPVRPVNSRPRSSSAVGSMPGPTKDRCQGRPPVAPGWQRAGSGVERFAEGEVEMDGAGSATHAAPFGDGTRRQRPPGVRRGGVGHARVGPPAHRASVQVGLLDGLGGADPLGFGRPVGGDCEQGDARVVCLGHRGVQLDRSGSARRDHDGGGARAKADSQGVEPGRPLVEAHVELDPGLGCERQHHRRRARAGAHHRMGHTRPDPLVDQRGAEGGGNRHRSTDPF